MSTKITISSKELVVIAIAVTALIAFASLAVYANANMQISSSGYRQNQGYGSGMMGGGLGGGSGMMGGGGMMGGYNNQNYRQASPNQPQQYYGQGMMGGGMMNGGGMMGGGMMSGGMMGGGMMGYYQNVSTALMQDKAAQIAKNYLASLNNPDLEIGELEEYSHNFYLSIVEKSTGKGAAEILIDRFTGSVHPEPQSMMWNTKYGGMGGMMGGGWFGGQRNGTMTVTPDEAETTAQRFLNVTYPRTETGEIITFDGYYTIMTTMGEEHYGMLSINGYTGAIWYHTWHGLFLADVETA